MRSWREFISKNYQIWLVFLLALVLRLLIYRLINLDNFGFSDVPHYIQVAKNIAEGRGFTIFKEEGIDVHLREEAAVTVMDSSEIRECEDYYYGIAPYGQPFTFWDPLLPHIMAVYLKFGDENFIAFNIFSCLLGSLSCCILYLIGRKLFNHQVGMLSGLIMAIEPSMIFYSSVLLTENIAVFLVLIAFWLGFRLREDARPWGLILIGAILSLSYLERSNLIILLPIFVIYLFLSLPKSYRFRAIYILIGFAIIGAPWWYRDLKQTGHLGFFPSKGVWNFWSSVASASYLAHDLGYDIRRDPDNAIKNLEARVKYPQALKLTIADGNTEYERITSMRYHTYKFIISNPVLTVKRYVIHLLWFFNPFPGYGNLIQNAIIGFAFVAIFILGIIGFILVLRSERRTYPIVIYIILFCLMGAWFRLGSRFRVPIMPFFMLTASYLLVYKLKIQKWLGIKG